MKLFIRSIVLLLLILSVDVFAAASKGLPDVDNVVIKLRYGFYTEPSTTPEETIKTLPISESIGDVHVEEIKKYVAAILKKKGFRGDGQIGLRLASSVDRPFNVRHLSEAVSEIITPSPSARGSEEDKILLIYMEEKEGHRPLQYRPWKDPRSPDYCSKMFGENSVGSMNQPLPPTTSPAVAAARTTPDTMTMPQSGYHPKVH